jgi:hypothetical protein
LSGDGVSFTNKIISKNAYLISGVIGDNSINISVKNSFKIGMSFFTDSINHELVVSTYKYQSQSMPNSVQFIITNDNASFISGTFTGRTYILDFNNTILDSLQITDGYFDIAK